MDSPEMEARPTEYKGVQYRSKCEAMFARYLDLKVQPDAFCYEPEWGGEKTDFVTLKVDVQFAENGPFITTEMRCIQYKPVRPTFTYANEFRKHWHGHMPILRQKLMSECLISPLTFIFAEIVWGSVYDTDRGRVWFDGNSCRFESTDWLAGVEQEVRTYRYDLQEGSRR